MMAILRSKTMERRGLFVAACSAITGLFYFGRPTLAAPPSEADKPVMRGELLKILSEAGFMYSRFDYDGPAEHEFISVFKDSKEFKKLQEQVLKTIVVDNSKEFRRLQDQVGHERDRYHPDWLDGCDP
jgi:hypothetical protein